ncbi:MAG: MATE family efflux transporter [Clostridiales bacterium]|nr:MATE family efflux transporter [Clostridiales bacterium]
MNKQNQMLGSEPINKLLFKLATPAIIGMMVNALYNLVDTFFVGRVIGKYAIAGLTVAFPIQMIIMAMAQLIGIGAASVISRSLGSNNLEKANHVAGIAIVLAAFVGVSSCILGLIFIDPILKLFAASGIVLEYAKAYMGIIFVGNIFVAFTVSTNSLVRAEGNAKVAMITMVIGTALNIVLDPLFIYVFDMGIKGAAYATVISQGVSFIYIISYFLRGKSTIKLAMHHFKLRMDYIIEIVTVGFPSFARQVAGSVMAVIINTSLVHFGGDVALSAYGLINKVTMFLFMPLFGIVQGMQPIVGFNYGAEKYDRVKKAILSSITAMTIMLVASWAVVQFFPSAILSIFLPFEGNQDVFAIGVPGIKMLLFGVPVIAIQIVSSSVYQAIGKSRPALLLSLLRQVILLIPLLLILPNIFGLGLTGIWLAYPLSDIISTTISTFMLREEFKLMSIKTSDSEDSLKCA